MNEQEDTRKKSRRDLLLVLLILPLGVLCMFMTGQVAIKLAPEWVLNADMRSLLDPNAEFAAGGIPFIIEPLNSGILTQPSWGNLFLTPNAPIPTRVISTRTPLPVNTLPPPLVPATPIDRPEPTATVVGPIIIVPTRGGPLQSDLQIEISDNSRTYTPGTSITYTILVTNLGPDSAPRFNVIANIPGVISGLTVNCTPANLCGTNTSSGNTISFTGATLPSSGVITISVSGIVASGVTGDLINTASIVIPSGVRVRDPNLANNTVTDTNTQLSVYDLAITKADGVDVYTTTAPLTYTVVVTNNNGPSDALGVSVIDNKPSQISSWTWTCTTVTNASGCNGVTNSTNNFNDTVNIQPGGRIEYTVRATPAVSSQNPQTISNTANIVFPTGPGFIDPNLSNNVATDTDIPYIDLSITKTDSVESYTPPGPVTYTITVTNNSPFNLTGVTVSDPKPPQVSTWEWCIGSACTGFINNDFSGTINLNALSNLVYTVTANISGTATGDLSNTATVTAPAGLVDAVPGNNSDMDTDIFGVHVDLQITKDDGVLVYNPGGSLNYTVVVTNNSTINLTGVTVTDNLPVPLISSWTWTCTPDLGASCTPGPSNSNINDTAVNLPAGGSVTYSITATVSGTATGALSNTATVSPPSGFIDTTTGNNMDIDTDTLNIADPLPPEIGTTPDNNYYSLTTGADLILNITTVVNGHPGPDLVYYEYLNINDGELYLDWIEVQVGDGTNWFTVFYWGDNNGNGLADTNSNMNFNNLLPPVFSPLPPPNELDQRHIQAADLTLFPPSGVSIDLDGYAPPGTYPFVRIIAPPGDIDGQLEIDAIITIP